jgi:peptide/nickel transport system permease protein
MTAKSVSKARAAPWLAFIPGLGHLALGRRFKGAHLLTVTAAGVFLLIWRAERVAAAFSSRAIDQWLASLVLIGSLSLAIAYSRRDVGRLLEQGDQPSVVNKSPWGVAIRRFKENKLAVVSVYMIVLLYVVALLTPLLAPYDPAAIDNVLETRYMSPSGAHLFGTDEFGRDMFSRALYGARVSLSVGFLAMLISKGLGTFYGAVAAYFGGIVDAILMRFVDVIIAFPTFYLMLMLVGVFEANILLIILILGFTSWPGTARYIRGEILSLKEQEFAESARAIGLPPRLIIIRHLVPSALSPVLVSAALSVAGMIGAEAGLSFLGLGIRPPTPSWGNMVSGGQDALLVAWWVAFFPGALLALTLISFSLLADGIRDALDPKVLMRRFV